MLEVFRTMSNIKKETMHQALKEKLEEDLEHNYEDKRKQVFDNIRLLNLG